jgi:hypothetical protein
MYTTCEKIKVIRAISRLIFPCFLICKKVFYKNTNKISKNQEQNNAAQKATPDLTTDMEKTFLQKNRFKKNQDNN